MLTTAVFHVLAVVLVVSGADKVVHPSEAATALRRLSSAVPAGTWVGRTLGGVEMVVGLCALALPGAATGALLAVAYGALTAFVVRLRRDAPDAGCGCFGSRTHPATRLHVGRNAAATFAALASGLGSPTAVEDAAEGVSLILYVVAVTAAAIAVLWAPAASRA